MEDSAPRENADFAEMAHRLGQRVKRYRARRGMSRKVLACQSGVSERYLAQLESGQANVSFNILWSLAQCMGTSVAALIEDREEESPDLAQARRLLESLSPDDQSAAYRLLRGRFAQTRASTGRVALIGLRGAGKTTLGRRLAEHYAVPFVRVTSLVEQGAGMDLAEIFLTLGQKGYRRLEFDALRNAVEQYPRAVLETGGSLVSEPDTFELLLESCFTIWLQASPQEHMARVRAQGDLRPMEASQQAMDDLKAILDSRQSFYGRADAVLDTSGRSIEECAEELIGMCGAHLGTEDPESREIS